MPKNVDVFTKRKNKPVLCNIEKHGLCSIENVFKINCIKLRFKDNCQKHPTPARSKITLTTIYMYIPKSELLF